MDQLYKSALAALFASYAEHRRQQDARNRKETATRFAQEAKRPRTVTEQVEIVQGAHRSIGYLRAECRTLLKALGKSPEASSLLRFVESWRALAERLKDDAARFNSIANLEASTRIVAGLRNAAETATLVRTALASGKVDSSLTEKVTALDDQGKELLLALDLALEALPRT